MYVAAGQGFAHWTRRRRKIAFYLPSLLHANAQYYSTMGALAAGGLWWWLTVQRFSFLGAGQAGQSDGGELYWQMMPVLSKQSPSRHDPDNQVRLFYGSPPFPRCSWKNFRSDSVLRS